MIFITFKNQKHISYDNFEDGIKILKGKCVYKDKKTNQQIITIDFFTRKRVKNKWIDIQYVIEYIMNQ